MPEGTQKFYILRLSLAAVFLLGLVNLMWIVFWERWITYEWVQGALSIAIFTVSLVAMFLTWWEEHKRDTSIGSFILMMTGTVSLCFFTLIMPALLIKVVPFYLYQSQLAYTTFLLILLIHSPFFSLSEQSKLIQRITLSFSVLLSVMMLGSVVWELDRLSILSPKSALLVMFGFLIIVDVAYFIFLSRIRSMWQDEVTDTSVEDEDAEQKDSKEPEDTEPSSAEQLMQVETEDLVKDQDLPKKENSDGDH